VTPRDPATEAWPATIVLDGVRQELPDPVVVEEPLEIRVGGAPLVVTLRTPGHDRELAAGFLYAEGIVHQRSDLVELRGADETAPGGASDGANRVEVRLRAGLGPDPTRAARSFLATAACGVCGKTAIDQVFARGLPAIAPERPRIAPGWLEALPGHMRAAQRVFARTGGLHAAALFDGARAAQPGARPALQVLREDVGRHNAVDKVVGERLLAGELPLHDAVLVLSGRAGFEIVQKAARAGIPVVAAVGAPSSLALRVAERSGMTLIGFLRPGRFNLYTGSGRLV